MSNTCGKLEEREAKPAKFGLFTGKLTTFILLALGQDNYRRFIKGFVGKRVIEHERCLYIFLKGI